jgi:hypothetical protein
MLDVVHLACNDLAKACDGRLLAGPHGPEIKRSEDLKKKDVLQNNR